MSRYRDYGPGDDAPLVEGDDSFTGFRSRVQPSSLPPGVARYLGNMRCDRGNARVRLGNKALGTDLVLSNPAVVLDFTLPTEIAVSSITRSSTTATVTTGTAHGYTTGDTIGIEGAAQAAYNGDFTITVSDTTHFTYTVSGSPATPATGTIVTAKDPRIFDLYSDFVRAAGVYADSGNVEGIVLVTTSKAWVYRYNTALVSIAFPSGETVASTDECAVEQYLNKVYIFRGYRTAAPLTVSALTRSSTTATVTTSAAHGLATDAWVTIAGATGAEYNGIFKITVTDTTHFTYTVSGTPTSPDASTGITARPCKPPLVWNQSLAAAFTVVTTGYHATGGTTVHMPAVDWGVQFTRRLVLPYSRDELILSSFGDADSYDTQYGQLRILPGGNDWLVGVMPYQLRGLIVLYRKSVHIVTLQTTNLAPESVAEVTRDFGCVARRTAANCGDFVLWLSDSGVRGVQIDFNLNIVPLKLPVSDYIQDIIARINWAYAAKAVGRFWNNRYYLAVPLDGATSNNTVLVFNFLNRRDDAPVGEWESVDTYAEGFDVVEFCAMDYAGERRLHAVTSFGWIFLLEQGETEEWGTPSTPITSTAIPGALATRDYRFNTLERKKFNRLQIETNLSASDALTATFVARNPDSTVEVLDYTAASDTDVSHRVRSGRQKGVAASIEIATTAGRPEIRTVVVEAALGDRKNFTRP